MTVTHRRVRHSATTAPASASAPMIQGHGDGPGTHNASPVTASSAAVHRGAGSSSPGSRRGGWPGSRCTAGGSTEPIQCVRWSCQIATGASETLCHTGAALASYSPRGAAVVGTEVRLRNTAGERSFCQTPCGPIRR